MEGLVEALDELRQYADPGDVAIDAVHERHMTDDTDAGGGGDEDSEE